MTRTSFATGVSASRVMDSSLYWSLSPAPQVNVATPSAVRVAPDGLSSAPTESHLGLTLAFPVVALARASRRSLHVPVGIVVGNMNRNRQMESAAIDAATPNPSSCLDVAPAPT